MEIKRFRTYNSFSIRKIIGILLIFLTFPLGYCVMLILLEHSYMLFFAGLMLNAEINSFSDFLFILKCIFMILLYFAVMVLPFFCFTFGCLLFFTRGKKHKNTEKNLNKLSKELKWNALTEEVKNSYKIPLRYTRYTIADVNAVTECQKNGERIIFLKSFLYTFYTKAEKIIIFTDAKQFVFSEYYGGINSDLSLENSTISQIGEN